jgi:ABC-type methionine transport system ATPase subunit
MKKPPHRRFAAQPARPHSIIVIEHDMVFIRQIAAGRKVTVLHQGSVLCEGPVDQVQNNEKVIEVYLGRKQRIALNEPRDAKSLPFTPFALFAPSRLAYPQC